MPKQDVRVELFYDGAWQNLVSDDDVLAEQAITITRGQGDQSPALRPASVSVRLANDDDRYRTSNPESPLYGKAGRNTPFRVIVGSSTRVVTRVASWKAGQSRDFRQVPRRGKAWVDVTAVGPLGRILQWRQRLKSALRREVDLCGVVPAEQWPMEDVAGSAAAVSVVGGASMRPVTTVRFTLAGGAPLPPGGAPDFARGAGVLGSDLLPSFQGGGTLAAPIRNAAFTGYAIDWVMQFQAGSDAGGTTSADVLQWRESGNYCQFTVNVTKGFVTVFHASAASLVTLSSVGSATAAVDPYDGVAHHYRYQVRQNGGNYSAALYVDSALYATADNFATPGLMLGTVGRPTSIEWNPGEASGDFMPTAAGHLTVWRSGLFGAQPPTFFALNGRAREGAHDRIFRLLSEENSFTFLPDSYSKATRLGPQRPDTLADMLLEIEATEDGLLFDSRTQEAIRGITRVNRYNQAVTVDLRPEDFAVLPVEELADDIGNIVTVAQRGGGDATARDDTGPLGTQDPPDGAGEYERRIDVNLYSESDLPQFAGYWLRKLTVDLPRYPRVTINLAALPAARVAQIEALDIGSVFTITAFRENPIRLHVLGYTETIGTHTRSITFNCASDQPFDVGTYDTRRYDLATCTLAAAVSPTATTLSLAITADESWSTASAYDLLIAGELVGVPAGGMSARAGVPGAYTQTLTGAVRSKNGIRKTLPVGSEVRVATPGRYGLRKDWL